MRHVGERESSANPSRAAPEANARAASGDTGRMPTRIAALLRIVTLALALGPAFLLATAAAHGEIADLPLAALHDGASVILVGECVKVESKVEAGGPMEHTGWFHHLRVERVERDPSGTIHPGDVVVLLSWNDAWTGKGQPPTYGSGHRGLPAKGERRRVYASDAPKRHGELLWMNVSLPNGWQPAGRTVVLVGADDEYRSEITMPLIADCLRTDAKATAHVAFAADPTTHAADPDNRTHIEGLDRLARADVAVFFMRWRELDSSSMEDLRRCFASGQPIVGLRTSTHMLRAPAAADGSESPLNNEWPVRIWGQRWISHHGHESRTRVLRPEGPAAAHPILRGIAGDIVVPSWLYDVTPLPADCTVLLWGEVVGGAEKSPTRQPIRQPIVWVRERGASTPTPFPGGGTPARRMAFTTLGHPGDFEEPQVRRLVEQMILWAAGDERQIPAAGVAAEPSTRYVAPATR